MIQAPLSAFDFRSKVLRKESDALCTNNRNSYSILCAYVQDALTTLSAIERNVHGDFNARGSTLYNVMKNQTNHSTQKTPRLRTSTAGLEINFF